MLGNEGESDEYVMMRTTVCMRHSAAAEEACHTRAPWVSGGAWYTPADDDTQRTCTTLHWVALRCSGEQEERRRVQQREREQQERRAGGQSDLPDAAMNGGANEDASERRL